MNFLVEVGLRVRQLRQKLKLTQEELAQRAGYTSRSSINKIEKGLVDIPQSKVSDLADALGTTPAYLMGWEEENDSKITIDVENYGLRPITKKRFRILGEIACGQPIFASEEHESYVDASASIDADFCLSAKGDSMINAGIKDGDVVFIKIMDLVDNGDIAAVIIDDEATLKRVYYYPDQQKLLLSPENPKYPPLIYENEQLDTINILGKAVCYMSML